MHDRIAPAIAKIGAVVGVVIRTPVRSGSAPRMGPARRLRGDVGSSSGEPLHVVSLRAQRVGDLGGHLLLLHELLSGAEGRGSRGW